MTLDELLVIPSPLFHLAHARKNPCPLRGTKRQVGLAIASRHQWFWRLRDDRYARIRMILSCVRDARYWVALARKPIEEFVWPRFNQMESILRTGACAFCGDPTYELIEVCSEECGEEIRNRAMLEAIREPR